VDLIHLLRKHFGTLNQAKPFRTELRTRKQKSGEQLLSSYVAGLLGAII